MNSSAFKEVVRMGRSSVGIGVSRVRRKIGAVFVLDGVLNEMLAARSPRVAKIHTFSVPMNNKCSTA